MNHVETGEPLYALIGQGPVVVVAESGEIIELGSAYPPDVAICELEERLHLIASDGGRPPAKTHLDGSDATSNRVEMLRELDELDRVEVVLDGVTVAIISDRVVTDMFWRSYRIEPVGDSQAIFDDDLWIRCRFAFRDPESQRMCTTAFAGGEPPYVSDGRVAIRAMYFDNEDSP